MDPANLNGTVQQIINPTAGMCVIKTTADVRGGKTLDVSGYTPTDLTIKEGHVIIEETSTGNLKPLNISAGAYVELPGSHTYKGVLTADILKAKPMSSVTIAGIVNYALAPYVIGSTIKTALGNINFIKD